jgi:hypothetical protein
VFFTFLPVACPGIQILLSVREYSVLSILILDVFSVLLPYVEMVFVRYEWLCVTGIVGVYRFLCLHVFTGGCV